MKRRTAPAYQPMAIPFKLDHFRVQRQAELERELQASPLYARMEALCGEVLADLDQEALRQTYPVPLAAFPVLRDAALRFQTVARLGRKIEVQLDPRPVSQKACRALVDGQRLVYVLTPALLQETRPEAMTYHLAANYFRDQHRATNRGLVMMRLKEPIQLTDRIKLMELLRLTAYAADAFAFVCCGSLDVAMAEGFRMGFDVALPPEAIDLNVFAQQAVKKPEFTVAQMLDHPERGLLYRPGRMPVLQRFAVSEPYFACLGESGGVPRADFEDEVLALDQAVHPPMKELSEEAEAFTKFAFFFGTVFVMGAAGAITAQREQALCEFKEIEPDRLRKLEKDLDWDVHDHAATRNALECALKSKGSELANVHCVEILRRAYLFARYEHGEKLPAEAQAALEELGRLCQLNELETNMVCEHFAGELAKIPDEEK